MGWDREAFIYALGFVAFCLIYAFQDQAAQVRPNAPSQEPLLVQPQAPSAPLPLDVSETFIVELGPRVADGAGTGFVVSDNGHFITARHVADSCKQIYVQTGKNRFMQARDIKNFVGVDFTTFRIPKLKVPSLDLETMRPRPGDAGYAMGYPQTKPADILLRAVGYGKMRSRGRYRAREPVTIWVELERMPNFSGALRGLSGGPILNQYGHVVGTAVAEDPRRGRLYTTDPSIFERSGILAENDNASSRITPALGAKTYARTGQKLRRELSVVLVYCET